MLNERKLTKSEEKRKEELVKRFKKDKRDWVARYGKDAEAAMYGTAVKNAKKQVEAMNNNRIKEAVKAALMQNKKVEENSYMEPEDYDDLMALKDATSIMDNIAELYKQAKKMGYGADVKRMVQDLDEELKGDQKKLDANGDGEISGKDFQILRSEKKKIREGFYGSSDIEDVTYALGYSNPYEFFEDNPGAIDALMDWIENIPEFRDMLKDADLMEDLDLGHEDNEPHMLKADLYRIGKYAMELYQMVDGFEGKGEVDFPHWWQSKVIKAKDALVGAKHYLDFELKEPQIDAMVDVAQDVEAIDEAKYTDYSNNELAAYVKNNPNDKTAAAELKKRSQKLKDLSRTDIKEAVGKFVVRPCSAKDTPWAVWQTSKDGENDKRIKGFKTKEDAKKFADEKNSLAESLNEDKFSLLKGASKQTIARDTEESDREYIATRQKRDKISQKMYGKDYRELDSRQKDKVNQLRRQSSQFESVNEESTTFKKGDKVTYLGYPAEITFVGKDQMGRIYYSVSYDKGQGRTKASNLYNKGGEIKPLDEVTKSQMLKKAKKGSYPATLVAIENGKVVAQEKVNTPQEAPAAHSVMSKKYPNANIRLEDSTGKILKEMMSLDDKAKAYYLAKIKNGEIDTLPEDPKAAFLAQMTKDQMDHDKETLRRERGLEEGTLTPSLSITNPIKEFATKLAKQLKENND